MFLPLQQPVMGTHCLPLYPRLLQHCLPLALLCLVTSDQRQPTRPSPGLSWGHRVDRGSFPAVTMSYSHLPLRPALGPLREGTTTTMDSSI